MYKTSFWTKLFGIKEFELYSTALEQESYSVLDEDLTRGYIFTTILMKSNKYTSTELTSYILVDFIAHMAAIWLGFYWIFKIVYMYLLPI